LNKAVDVVESVISRVLNGRPQAAAV